MRILHLVHQYLPEHIGGTELYTHWLTRALSQRGHCVTIFYRRSVEGVGLNARDEDGVRIWAAWSGLVTSNRRFLATFGEPYVLQAFRQVIAETQPDLVHLQHLMGLPVALVHHLQRLKLPFIITLHDYWWVCANAQLLTNYSQQVCAGPRAYLNCARCALVRAGQPHLWPAIPLITGPLAWRNYLLRQVMHAARRLIAPTQFVRNWYAGRGVPLEKFVVIPHGLEYPSFGSLPEQTPETPPIPPALSSPRQRGEERETRLLSAMERELGGEVIPDLSALELGSQGERNPNDPIRFAYIGGLSWQKGVHILVRAFSQMVPGGELWIAGDESADLAYASRLRTQATPNVRFLGRLSRAEVWQILAQIDVVVIPSLWYETFSIIVSEAFAAGVPVIASRLGPLADRVHDGVDGLLVPPGDWRALRSALLRFLQDPTLLPRLRAGIRPVPTLQEHIQEIEAVYRGTLA